MSSNKVAKKLGGLVMAPFEPADATAVQAVFEGQASDEQQRRAMRWILNGACRIHEISFHPENTRLSDFNEGQRFVGKQIAELLRTDVRGLIAILQQRSEE